jgi:hypothetical protein
VLQFVDSLAVVGLWTDVLGLPAALGLFPALLITVPMTFVLARWVFVRRHDAHRPAEEAAHRRP